MSFKEKLKQLLDISYHQSNNVDTNFNLEILYTKRLLRKKENSLQLYKKQKLNSSNNLLEDYSLFNSTIHSYSSFYNKNNKKKALISIDQFNNEKSISKINSLIRSFSLKDIHNKNDCLNLNRSFSILDINENERNNNLMKKKIKFTKKYIGLSSKDKILLFNKPLSNLNSSLKKLKIKNFFDLTLRNRFNINKKRYINYPKSKILRHIKSNSISYKDFSKDIKNINNNNSNKLINTIVPKDSISLKRQILLKSIDKI